MAVRYGRRLALADTDLEVAAGDIVAVLGPNGSGKSTLVRTLAGDLTPAQGHVRRAPGTSLGYAADEAVHADALSVLTNARLFARANGGASALSSLEPLLADFGLANDLAMPAGQLSFGGRRKLALVQALAHAPSLLLLDEPTVGLDPDSVDALFEHLRAAARRTGAAVLATNDVRAASTVASRIVFLRDGGKIADAPPAELLAAVRGQTRIEIDLESAPPAVEFPIDVLVAAHARGWVLESPRGTSALAGICAALADADARVLAIRVNEPDLTDAFRVITGDAWIPTRTGEAA